MQHRHAKRTRGFSYVGIHRYLLTFCTHYRAPLFTSAEAVDLALTQILRAVREERFALIAYCFMPDHLHLLIKGDCEASDCKAFIRRAKQYSGFYYSKSTWPKAMATVWT